jgi:hypothetical protein
MTDGTDVEGRLADLAAMGSRYAVPPAAEQIRGRGERRRRRKRAAAMSGGVMLVAAVTTVVALNGVTLPQLGRRPAPPAAISTAAPAPDVSRFVPPAPAAGEEYASDFGHVSDPVTLGGDQVRVTVERLRAGRGTAVPTGETYRLTLSAQTPVEVEQASDGGPGDVTLAEFLGALRAEPRRVFAIDYDSEGRVQSLREAFWLTAE